MAAWDFCPAANATSVIQATPRVCSFLQCLNGKKSDYLFL